MLERASEASASMADAGRTTILRRSLFALLVISTSVALLWLLALTLAPGGLGMIDCLILFAFAVTLPWNVVGFWNAAIGFFIMRFSTDPAATVLPAAVYGRGDDPITASTAILLCIRNESPDKVLRNIDFLLSGLLQSGAAERFHIYVLSDTDEPTTAQAEDLQFTALRDAWHGRVAVTYRRRTSNAGFKAGNIGDFCERWGNDHEFAVTLDADSVMSAEAVLRLVRIMQRSPQIGILQGMVVGLPSTSAFARIFQFGMRLGMQSFTLGSAWWQADCGPYWGHNAVLRLKPFIDHCALPLTASGGHFLSHDQLEAVLMRRGGFEVRVLPEEGLGWEENPPTLLEFMRRDLRWCRGNMQYWPLLTLPGLRSVSRFQLAFAMVMFVNSPAWISLLVLGSILVAFAGDPSTVIRPDAGAALLVIVLLLWFAPKIATAADILMRTPARHSFGGGLRFCVSFVMEAMFSMVLLPIMWFSHTLFLIRALFGGTIGWNAQSRDPHLVSAAEALRLLWPQTLAGLAIISLLAVKSPTALPYVLLLASGLALSVPFAIITSWPGLGRWLWRAGLGCLPEETAAPHALATLALPAMTLAITRPVSERCL